MEPKKEKFITKVLNGFEYLVDGDSVTIIVNKDIKINFSPLSSNDLEKYKMPLDLYDKNVLTKYVRAGRPVPLKAEPPRNYVSPELSDNGQTENHGVEFVANLFGVNVDTYMKASKTASEVYAKEILRI